ncbi:MAG: tRNA uridine-5-carboxymethylaminomethyl(34) synthesis GTPase MnmE [Candidatus Methanofastidiosa archaeon]|nr:tRNA uridine-5-carboxymethylaminomethyl(34) synthesis GTPase MnmE [Candidatus Methanofastidiosa archaeon]
MNTRSDTIAAISTPAGIGGIGIIRISGSKAIEVTNRISHTTVDISQLNHLKARKIIYSKIIDKDESKIDEVILVYMPAKKSFTGEQTIEIQCHGGRAVLSLILSRVLESGARMAKPGEFTRRAFENGRINLIQAEAINELIKARSGVAVKAAWRQYDGGLNTTCEELRNFLINVKTDLQAMVDFEIDLNELKNLKKAAEKIYRGIDELLIQQGRCRTNNSIIWITLVGPANSGKSSIFNRILRSERSIVSDTPGTTTDYISEVIELEGKEVRITDTAGFKIPDTNIQKSSIERTIKQQEAADIVLYVFDQSQDLTDHIQEISRVINSGGIILFNKCDLPVHQTVSNYIETRKDFLFKTSAVDNTGIEEVLNCIAEKVSSEFGENTFSINMRQKNLLFKAKEELKAFLDIKQHERLDICLFHINETIKSLSEIIGDISNEEILGSIFSNFCIGK